MLDRTRGTRVSLALTVMLALAAPFSFADDPAGPAPPVNDPLRLLAGVRGYPPEMLRAVLTLGGDPTLLRALAEKPQLLEQPERITMPLSDAARAAMETLRAVPEIVRLAAAYPNELDLLRRLFDEKPQAAQQHLEGLRRAYGAARLAGAAAWQEMLERDPGAWEAYVELVTRFCRDQIKEFPDYPHVVVTKREYYLAAPPNELLIAFAEGRETPAALAAVLAQWWEEFAPERLDQFILAGHEGPRPAVPVDRLVATMPPNERKAMWRAPEGGGDIGVGLMPVILQPPADQPPDAQLAYAVNEHARLWAPRPQEPQPPADTPPPAEAEKVSPAPEPAAPEPPVSPPARSPDDVPPQPESPEIEESVGEAVVEPGYVPWTDVRERVRESYYPDRYYDGRWYYGGRYYGDRYYDGRYYDAWDYDAVPSYERAYRMYDVVYVERYVPVYPMVRVYCGTVFAYYCGYPWTWPLLTDGPWWSCDAVYLAPCYVWGPHLHVWYCDGTLRISFDLGGGARCYYDRPHVVLCDEPTGLRRWRPVAVRQVTYARRTYAHYYDPPRALGGHFSNSVRGGLARGGWLSGTNTGELATTIRPPVNAPPRVTAPPRVEAPPRVQPPSRITPPPPQPAPPRPAPPRPPNAPPGSTDNVAPRIPRPDAGGAMPRSPGLDAGGPRRGKAADPGDSAVPTPRRSGDSRPRGAEPWTDVRPREREDRPPAVRPPRQVEPQPGLSAPPRGDDRVVRPSKPPKERDDARPPAPRRPAAPPPEVGDSPRGGPGPVRVAPPTDPRPPKREPGPSRVEPRRDAPKEPRSTGPVIRPESPSPRPAPPPRVQPAPERRQPAPAPAPPPRVQPVPQQRQPAPAPPPAPRPAPRSSTPERRK